MCDFTETNMSSVNYIYKKYNYHETKHMIMKQLKIDYKIRKIYKEKQKICNFEKIPKHPNVSINLNGSPCLM